MKELFATTGNGMAGLLIFFLVFCAMLVWTLRPSAKSTYEDHGQIPLREDDENE